MSKPPTGHVRQRKNGLWEGQYVFQRQKRSIYGEGKEEVEKQLDKIASRQLHWICMDTPLIPESGL